MQTYRAQFRLPYYNYASSGIYFVTICSYQRIPLFCSVSKGSVILTPIGTIISECVQNLPRKFSYMSLDEWIIMPDHIHVILVIENPDEPNTIAKRRFAPQPQSLSIIVRNLKSVVTLLVRRQGFNGEVWQSRFFDRIIRNETELQRIRTYILNNPRQWDEDHAGPDNII